MKCKKCSSENIKIDYVEVSSLTKTNHTSLVRKLARLTFIIATCGLWLLISKRKENSRTKVKNQKKCMCQNCGYSWSI